jgi:proline dehydrogenase
MISRFIGGNNIHKAITRLSNSVFFPIYDYAKESSTKNQDILNYMNRIKSDVKVTPKPAAFALKYSSFDNDMYLQSTVYSMLPYVSKILLDAENNKFYEKEQNCYDNIIDIYNSKEIRVYKTYQCYRLDSMNSLVDDIMKHKNLGIKLVRGAYYEQDVKHNILYANKHDTDKNYNNAIKYILHKMRGSNIKLIIATHNNDSIDSALAFPKLDKNRVYFAQLLGMNDALSYKLANNGYKVFKYVPYGNFRETLPYLTRRLYENYDILKYI